MYRICLFLFCLLSFSLEGKIFSRVYEKPPISAVVSFDLTVSNMARSIEFYTKILGFRKVADYQVSGEPYDTLYDLKGSRIHVVRLRLGLETLTLMEFEKPKGRPLPIDLASDDIMFQHIAIVVSDLNQAYGSLLKNQIVTISPEPQKLPSWNLASSGIQALYFRDPDGHPLELIQFPPGKGNPRWQQTHGQLFLGIDHSAITIKNTSKSLEFYQHLLGLKITGDSLNYGPEQEKLTGVKGAKVYITSLNAEQGPGIELLDYLTPNAGRDMPPDTRANDLWHWQIRLQSPELAGLHQSLVQANTFVRKILSFQNPYLDYHKAFLTRDPDGHTLLITQ
ncbi:VOC family protein [Simkania negevensis]|uniref:Glr1161 protein n=1 Tax=Simkania negevensis (strain ATCC VR-1471 / DSM 27360 / Z) TaxID=331113 RepID=F8L8G8_SIMNZ|nr:VOC family protein [Simkania negevensis]CCB89092.1 glr1161 protein [Simkania negevensis Z]